MPEYQFHPIADIFPLLPEAELLELADDIRVNGLNHPIVLFECKVLDGRNRYTACQRAGVAPKFIEFAGKTATDALEYVWSENFHRRHLTSSQRAACWELRARYEENVRKVVESIEAESQKRRAETQGRPPKAGKKLPSTLTEVKETRQSVAETAKTSPAYVSDVKHFTDAQLESVKCGDKSVPQVKREAKREELRERAKLPDAKYRVIYADPPWNYGDNRLGLAGENTGGAYTAAETHYPVMTITDLCALDVRSIVEENAVLFLWVTSPLLDECWPVIKAWGFTYKSSFVWDKVGHNFGHYNSVRHEFLLVCTRGSCLPDVPELVDSVVSIEKTREHSAKPAAFREMIDKLYPHGKRIELFARAAADGWDRFGNEC